MPAVEVWPNKQVQEQAPQDPPENFLHSISRGYPRKWETKLKPGAEKTQRAQYSPRNLSSGNQPSIAEAFAHAGDPSLSLLCCNDSMSVSWAMQKYTLSKALQLEAYCLC